MELCPVEQSFNVHAIVKRDGYINFIDNKLLLIIKYWYYVCLRMVQESPQFSILFRGKSDITRCVYLLSPVGDHFPGRWIGRGGPTEWSPRCSYVISFCGGRAKFEIFRPNPTASDYRNTNSR